MIWFLLSSYFSPTFFMLEAPTFLLFFLQKSLESLWVTWGQKLRHHAKSKENLFNTLGVTFLKWSSWILLKIIFEVVIMNGAQNVCLDVL